MIQLSLDSINEKLQLMGTDTVSTRERCAQCPCDPKLKGAHFDTPS